MTKLTDSVQNTVVDACVAAVEVCIINRNQHDVFDNVGVVITKKQLGVKRVTVKMADKIIAIMKQHGIKETKYNWVSSQFTGVVNLEHAVISSTNSVLVSKA